jgi:hypothetical protein
MPNPRPSGNLLWGENWVFFGFFMLHPVFNEKGRKFPTAKLPKKQEQRL